MNTYIALLRGINVSGQKKIMMTDLKKMFESLGFSNVKTYIQSGNVAFGSEENSIHILEKTISEGIKSRFEFDVSVLVKTKNHLVEIFKKCPFTENKKVKSYFIILHKKPDKSLVNFVMEMNVPNEEFHIINSCVYIYYSHGAGKAKCGTNFFENKLKVSATARNYNTITKLIALAS